MSEPVTVDFLFDFGSPNAYLCHRVLPAIAARSGAHIRYVPILLGGLFRLANNRSPAESNAGIPNKRAYEALEMQRFIDRHGLQRFRMNPHFPVNTLKIMRIACAAQDLGCFERCVEVLYAGMWEQGLDLADDAVIAATLGAGGLDAAALAARAQAPEVKARLLANTEQAHQRGAFGSPTFFVGDAIYFGKDRLRDVEEAVAAARAG